MRSKPAVPHPRSFLVLLLLAVTCAALAPAAVGATPRLKVFTAQNATLDKRILVTRSGLSLYWLEGERNGRWLCTDRSCLSAWPPLLLRSGAQPTGVRFLGAVRRPDGRRQVTYRGRPLYRYAFDEKKGDVRGDGVGDVAVWHVAVAPRR
jgi:predicted lipoprotein with Yx(FWY)xxD motif